VVQFGGLTPADNVVLDNTIVGNTNGIMIDPGAKGNFILRNLVVGNPAVQVSVNNPTTAGVDIRNAATPGDNIVEGNVCLTAVNAACSIFDDRAQR
jgi:parallel beta-helix repeat protein